MGHRPVGEFSKGMARRLGLAQALINDPSSRAAASVARDPSYAATAAALYMGAAMFRFQNDEAAIAAMARDAQSRPLVAVQGVQPLSPVS